MFCSILCLFSLDILVVTEEDKNRLCQIRLLWHKDYFHLKTTEKYQTLEGFLHSLFMLKQAIKFLWLRYSSSTLILGGGMQSLSQQESWTKVNLHKQTLLKCHYCPLVCHPHVCFPTICDPQMPKGPFPLSTHFSQICCPLLT